MTAAAPSRRTQEERSAGTRAALLDSTLELLVEVGYARTTTQAVAARAGLSRGAQLHHFPTRAELVVAAVRHLAEKRLAELALTDATAAGLGRLATLFTGPLFLAALELVVAARTDPDLRAAVLPFEAEVVHGTRALAARMLDLPLTHPRCKDLVDLTLDLLRGLGVAALLGDSADLDRRRERLLATWSTTLQKEHA